MRLESEFLVFKQINELLEVHYKFIDKHISILDEVLWSKSDSTDIKESFSRLLKSEAKLLVQMVLSIRNELDKPDE